MLTALMVLLRSLGLICGGHQAIVLENLALRQQLAVLTRTVKRPQLRSTDRLFWILLAKGWQDWRSALIARAKRANRRHAAALVICLSKTSLRICHRAQVSTPR